MKRDSFMHLTYKTARRVVVTVAGATVIGIGVLMIVLPGPATVVIPAGLAILGLEFAWARRWLRKVKKRIFEQFETHKQVSPQQNVSSGAAVRTGKKGC